MKFYNDNYWLTSKEDSCTVNIKVENHPMKTKMTKQIVATKTTKTKILIRENCAKSWKYAVQGVQSLLHNNAKEIYCHIVQTLAKTETSKNHCQAENSRDDQQNFRSLCCRFGKVSTGW